MIYYVYMKLVQLTYNFQDVLQMLYMHAHAYDMHMNVWGEVHVYQSNFYFDMFVGYYSYNRHDKHYVGISNNNYDKHTTVYFSPPTVHVHVTTYIATLIKLLYILPHLLL